MANIGIIGYGFVGKAVEFGFKKSNKIYISDPSFPSLSIKELVSKSDFIFVCVPTPMDSKMRHIDLSIIEQVAKQIADYGSHSPDPPIIVLKSTIIPGTTKRLAHKFNYLRMAFNPEFLTQDNYLDDFINTDRIIIGSEDPLTTQKLLSLYRSVFSQTKIFTTDSTSAEMVKYMCNTFLATKVIFANEIYDLCQKLGIDYAGVKQMVVADHRIYDSHLDVTPQRGFGGKCFPKDTVALLGFAKKIKVPLSVLAAAWKKNLSIRLTRDWEQIPGAITK